MNDFWLVFFPLFVAVDAFGILPVFWNLTEKLAPAKRRKVVVRSLWTAGIVAAIFLSIGQGILKVLHITISDFLIAGGALLFVISINSMTNGDKKQSTEDIDDDTLGAVPIGVPLIVGPAVLTTSLILINQYGVLLTALSVAINMIIVGFVFFASDFLARVIGKTGANAISKLAHLLIAAIAVMMIRKGIFLLLAAVPAGTW